MNIKHILNKLIDSILSYTVLNNKYFNIEKNNIMSIKFKQVNKEMSISQIMNNILRFQCKFIQHRFYISKQSI